jgi:hypothetical protein
MSKKLTDKKSNGAGKKTGRSALAGKIATKKSGKKKELTADEMLLRIWKKTYATRHKRLDV